MTNRLAPFCNQKYLNLETFRRDGRGVKTQVANWLLDQKYLLKKLFNLLTKLHRHQRGLVKK